MQTCVTRRCVRKDYQLRSRGKQSFAQNRVVTLQPCDFLGIITPNAAGSFCVIQQISKVTTKQAAFIDQNNVAVSVGTLRVLLINAADIVGTHTQKHTAMLQDGK